MIIQLSGKLLIILGDPMLWPALLLKGVYELWENWEDKK